MENEFLSDKIDYGRRLVQAGVSGMRAGEVLNNTEASAQLSDSVRGAFKAAAVGAGLAYLGYCVTGRRKQCLPSVIAWSALAFCAEFAWGTRSISSKLADGAARQISRVRDEHWLERNPLDYA